VNKARRQKWLDLIADYPGTPLCIYCKHFDIVPAGTWESPETEPACFSPLGAWKKKGAYFEQAFDECGDCWRFANRLPYKEAEGE
jgi:hypothetical protein